MLWLQLFLPLIVSCLLTMAAASQASGEGATFKFGNKYLCFWVCFILFLFVCLLLFLFFIFFEEGENFSLSS